MNQNRKRNEEMPNRSSSMEPAEGSRDTVMNSGSDLGTSSDRAMFDERMREGDRSSRNRGSDERGSESNSERNRSDNGRAGGVTNRALDQERAQQDRLPERGRSESER